LIVATYLQGLESNGGDGIRPPKVIEDAIFYLRKEISLGEGIHEPRERPERSG
jgi:hypothetical protein